MTAFVGYDNKLYLGKSENYLFGDNGFAYYDNSDKSLTYITDNLTLYPFLYGSGWVCSQQEMLDNGSLQKKFMQSLTDCKRVFYLNLSRYGS